MRDLSERSDILNKDMYTRCTKSQDWTENPTDWNPTIKPDASVGKTLWPKVGISTSPTSTGTVNALNPAEGTLILQNDSREFCTCLKEKISQLREEERMLFVSRTSQLQTQFPGHRLRGSLGIYPKGLPLRKNHGPSGSRSQDQPLAQEDKHWPLVTLGTFAQEFPRLI